MGPSDRFSFESFQFNASIDCGTMRKKRKRRDVISSSSSSLPSLVIEGSDLPVRSMFRKEKKGSAARFVVGASTRVSEDEERVTCSDLSDFVVSSSVTSTYEEEEDGSTREEEKQSSGEGKVCDRTDCSRRPTRRLGQVLLDSDGEEHEVRSAKREPRRSRRNALASPVQAVLENRQRVLQSAVSVSSERGTILSSETSSDLEGFIASDADPDPSTRRNHGMAPLHAWSENGDYWTYLRYLLLCECDRGFHENLVRLAKGSPTSAEANGARHLLSCARQVESSICDRKHFLVSSTAWTPSFKSCVSTRPRMYVEPCRSGLTDCEACGRANHPSAFIMRLDGKTYDAESLWIFDTKQASRDEAVDPHSRRPGSDGQVDFLVGRFCCARAQIYHALHHCKHHLLKSLRCYLNRGNSAMESVDSFLKDERKVRSLYEATQRLQSLSERYCAPTSGASWSAREGDVVSDELQELMHVFRSDYGATSEDEASQEEDGIPSKRRRHARIHVPESSD